MSRGRLITLEGGEGAGKSTVLASLRAQLGAACTTLHCSREPGGTPLGEKLRGLLLDEPALAPVPMAELLMMFASRAQLCETLIAPALARGDWVLCDRFTDASYAYQGGGRALGAQAVAACEALATSGLQPDLTLLLDLPPAVGMQRIADRSKDRIEAEATGFFERVRHAYLERARAHPARFVVIDASQALAQVQAQVSAAVADRLQRWGAA